MQPYVTSETIESKSREWLKKTLYSATESLEGAINRYEALRGIIQVPWCGEDNCGISMAEQFVGNALGYNESKKLKKFHCLGCGTAAKYFLHFGKTY